MREAVISLAGIGGLCVATFSAAKIGGNPHEWAWVIPELIGGGSVGWVTGYAMRGVKL